MHRDGNRGNEKEEDGQKKESNKSREPSILFICGNDNYEYPRGI